MHSKTQSLVTCGECRPKRHKSSLSQENLPLAAKLNMHLKNAAKKYLNLVFGINFNFD